MWLPYSIEEGRSLCVLCHRDVKTHVHSAIRTHTSTKTCTYGHIQAHIHTHMHTYKPPYAKMGWEGLVFPILGHVGQLVWICSKHGCSVLTVVNDQAEPCSRNFFTDGICAALRNKGSCSLSYVQRKCCKTCHRSTHLSKPKGESWSPNAKVHWLYSWTQPLIATSVTVHWYFQVTVVIKSPPSFPA